jgi:hypothetical protein
VLGSLSGTSPGTSVGGLVLPLNGDAYFAYTLVQIGQPPLSSSAGVLGALGEAQAVLGVPPATSPVLAAVVLDHAYLGFDAGTFAPVLVSNPVHAVLIP